MQALEALRHSLFLFVSTLTGSVKNLLTPIWERVVFGVKNIADWTFFGLESFRQATFSRLVFWGEKMQDALIGQSLISFALLILSILLGWLLVKIVRNLFLNLKLLDLKEKVELFFEKNNKKITKKSKENIFSKLKKVLVFSQKKSQHNFEFISKEQKKIILKKQREASGHIFIATKYPALASSALVLFAMLCYSLPEKYQLASLMQSVEMRQTASKNATSVNQVGDYPLNQDLINQTPTKNEKIIAKSNAGQEMVLAETDINLSADNQSAISSDFAKAMADKTADQSKKTILLTGVLTDNNGQPVTGEYVARFAIYTKDRENIDPYPSDTDKNSRIWEENQTITFKKGLFSVSLGLVRDLPVFTNLDSSQFYVGMRIGTDSEMAPRKKVSTPFFALNSANSVLLNGKKVGLDAGDIIALNENGQVNLENLPIGTKKDQLVLGSDKRLKMTVSGASFVTLSGQELTISKVNLTSDIEGVLEVAQGGLGLSSYSAGDMLYYATGNKLSKLAIGADGQTLSVVGGVPTWSDTTSGVAHKLLSDSHSDTTVATVLRGDLITGQGASASWSRLAIGASGQFLYSDGVDTNWHTLTKGDVNLGNVENITLSTWTGSTNLTTLGTITTGVWNGSAVDVARGGTGANTFASNYLLKGNGASALSSSILYDNGTNVGIGTVTPDSFKVEVAGDIGPESDNTRNLGSPARYFNTAYIKNLVTGTSGAVGYWNRTGNVLSPITNGDTVSIFAGASNASGTIFNVSYTGSTVTLDGSLIGAKIDLNDGHVIPTNQSVTGVRVVLPTTTNTNLVGTTVTMDGMSLGYGVGTGINQTGAGTTIYSGAQLLMPALTQTAGTLIANGALITTPSSITTGGTANGISISATGVGAGVLNGISVSSITGSTGTETALRIGSGWDSVLSVNGNQVVSGAGVVLVSAGGTGITSYTAGDIIYADSANSFTKLPGGAGNNGKALVISGGVPTWGVVSGSTCSDCVLNDPTAVTTQTITPNNEDISSLIVRQTTHSSPTHDIFSVTNATGSTRYFYVDQNGNVSTGGVASQSITLTPTSDTPALTLVGTNVATANLAYLNAKNTQGTIFNLAYGTSTTLADALIGAKIDLATNLTASDQSVTGISLVLPSVTNTTSTSTYRGLAIGLSGGAGVNQNGAGVTVFSGIDVTIPPLTQTAGTLTGNGILITTPSSITTGGTANGINISATGVGAGTLRGVNVGNITAGAGAETAIRTGTGWDYAAIFEAGNVGIGTTAPGAKLHIEDGVLLIKPISGDSTGIRIRERDDGNDAVKISGGASSGIVDIMDGGVATIKLLGSGNSYFNNGNIGIGTTTPGAKFEVYGSSVAATGLIYANDGTNFAALDPTYGVILNRANAYVNNRNIGGDLNLRVSNLAALDKIGLTIQSDGDVQIMNGNVGIGTTSPSVKLEVVSSGQVFNSVQDVGSGQSIFTLSRINHTTQNNVWNESITNTTGTNGSLIIYPTGVTADIGFSGNTSWLNQQLVIKGATGNVGIGTTGPNRNLEIYGSNPYFRITDSRTSSNWNFGDVFSGIEFFSQDEVLADPFVQSYIKSTHLRAGTSHTDADAGLEFGVSNANTVATTAMVIANGGNVGIGTTSPLGKLHLYKNNADTVLGEFIIEQNGTGDSSIQYSITGLSNWITGIDNSDSDKFKISNSNALGTSDMLTIDSSGNVGIGTTSPGQKLDVVGENATALRVTSNTDNAFVIIDSNQDGLGGEESGILLADDGSNKWEIYKDTSNDFRLYDYSRGGTSFRIADNGNMFLMEAGGNVGIGTTSPISTISGLDISSGGRSIVIGAENGLSTRTDNVGKYGRILGAHYTNAEQPIVGLLLGSYSGTNQVSIGGGTSLGSAATFISFYTASNTITPTGTERMRIDSAGNVGIGTTSPTTKLDVKSTGANDAQLFVGTTLAQAIGNTAEIILSPASGFTSALAPRVYSYIDASNQVSLRFDTYNVGRSTRMTIAPDGNVGIGTTSPGNQLHLYTNTTVSGATGLKIENTASDGYANLSFSTNAGVAQFVSSGSTYSNGALRSSAFNVYSPGANGIVMESASATGQFQVVTGGNATGNIRMTVDQNGNVGIGTTSPRTKLDIYGGLTFGTASGSSAEIKSQENAGGGNYRDLTVYGNDITFRTADSDEGVNSLNRLTIANTTGDISILKSGGTGTFFQYSSGNVGIGTTTPGAKLDVQGNIFLGTSSSSNPYLYFQNDGNDMQIASPGARLNFGDGAGNVFMSVTDEGTTGNVGIGTTSPAQKLHITGGNVLLENNQYLIGEKVGGDDVNLIGIDASSNTLVQAGAGNNLIFKEGGDEWMRITSSGNVGIGTVSPDAKIHILGSTDYLAKIQRLSDDDNKEARLSFTASTDVTYEGSYIGSIRKAGDSGGHELIFATQTGGTTPSEKMRINNLGNVGIGTTSPGAKLHLQAPDGTSQIRVQGDSAYTDMLQSGENFYYKKSSSTGSVIWADSSSNAIATVYIGSRRFAINGTPTATLTGIKYSTYDLLDLTSSVAGDIMKVTNAGNVGIGTTSPGAKFEVAGVSSGNAFRVSGGYAGFTGQKITVDEYGTLKTSGGLTNVANNLLFAASGEGDSFARFGFGLNTGAPFMAFGSGSTTRDIYVYRSAASVLKIDSDGVGGLANLLISGNVGIGTTSPARTLHVYGQGAISNADDSGAFLFIPSASVNTLYSRAGQGSSTALPLAFTIGNTEQVRITTSGNVGIGTTSPGAKLNVSVGSTDAVTGLLINQNDLDKTGLQIANATSATATMLDLASNSSAGDVFNLDWDLATTMSDVLTGVDLDFTNLSADGVSALYGLRINDPASATGSTEYGILLQGTNWDKALYSQDDIGLADSANLFLGTGNDLQLYHNGTDSYITNNTGKLYLGSAATSDLLLQANGGKVGIGTTSPDTTLKIVGSICASATDTACFGTTAGNIYAANFIVDGTTHLPDYVFEADYPLQSIEELKNYLLENKHLPGVPSASEVIQTGLNLSQMVPAILEKTEENTLYIISQNDQITSITQNQNKIVEQLTGQLADQNISLDNKLQLIGQALDDVETRLVASLRAQIDEQTKDIMNLQKQMADIELQNKAFNEFLLAFDVKSIDNFAKLNAPVNVFLGKIIASDIEALGIIKATDIEATNMLKGQNLELGSQVSGTNLIKAGELESAKILTSEANAGIKLYITPKGSTQGKTLYYDESDIEIGVGFKVRIDAPALEKDVEFNWLIVK